MLWVVVGECGGCSQISGSSLCGGGIFLQGLESRALLSGTQTLTSPGGSKAKVLVVSDAVGMAGNMKKLLTGLRDFAEWKQYLGCASVI